MRTLILSIWFGIASIGLAYPPWPSMTSPDGDCQKQKIIRQEIIAEAKTNRVRGKKTRGLSVLAIGDDGARTAGLLASDLGTSVYRVDLKQLVGKYIGETEKNLKLAFEAAARQKSILLLDEADALFGKRSEVKDSHDRYANRETNYLLAQIDHYDGTVVLAAKRKESIDAAFLRRLRFRIDPC